jgi:histidyl-tRNA synthetase
MKFQAIKGTRDFYPADMAVRNWIFDAWRRVSVRHGFQQYDGPIFEYLDLYRAKSGEGIVSELFHFQDRGGRELAIRPEMTPTLARMIAARAQALPRPIKWFSMPRLCRAEKPQRGRLREFFQWNIDIVGIDDAVSDAECILVMVDFLREVGLTPEDAMMRINSRSLLSTLLEARGFAAQRHEALFAVLDKRDKVSPEAFGEMVEQATQTGEEKTALLAIGQAAGAQGLNDVAALAEGNATAEAEIARLREVFEYLRLMGVADYCVFDMGVVRGLAYYTGVVFEGFGKGGLQRAICGGGRYDRLLEVVGGGPMSGIGFGTSDVVIQDLLADRGKLPEVAALKLRPEFFVIDADAALFPQVVSLVAELRRAGHAAQFSYRRQNVGKQLKQAAADNVARVVIVGSEYIERGGLTVKDLATGRQAEIDIEQFRTDPLHFPSHG